MHSAGPILDASSSLPIWALRAFMPAENDAGGLSLFEVESENEALIIAASFAFNRDKMESGQTAFISIDLDSVRKAHINVESTPGKIGHVFADPRHREIQINDLDTLQTVARLFLSGELISFEGKTVFQAAKDSARDNQFVYKSLFNNSYDGNQRFKNVLRLLREGCVSIQGVKTS